MSNCCSEKRRKLQRSLFFLPLILRSSFFRSIRLCDVCSFLSPENPPLDKEDLLTELSDYSAAFSEATI